MCDKRYRWIGAILAIVIACMGVWISEASAAEAPDDPFYEKQRYLQQIHIPVAWETIKGRSLQPVTVAVVDTGVDLQHPDLKARLVPGTNIIQPSRAPQDDSGHGTAVAGVIAAVSQNGIGIAGIAPNVRIMPIKAVRSDGNGEEEHLGQGIRYAVDHGADIVVLSLGLNLYSPYLSDIVDYAESKGVLLVAATGNKGQPVMFPAAYPTVIAVGGASVTNEYKDSSNFGPEVELIAPWYVYTTANGGKYNYKEGTSMAAPQAAAVAALMLGLQPELTPADVRERLRQSAEPITPGWNPYSGYGLLRADQALTIAPKGDMYEPNDQKSAASSISVIGIMNAEMAGKKDIDWFTFDPPYKGDISVRISGTGNQPLPLELTADHGDGRTRQKYDLSDGKTVRISTSGERLWISLRAIPSSAVGSSEVIPYRLETNFHIYTDPFEPNDKAYQASTLPVGSGQVTGTFHKVDDHDWFAFRFTSPGTLRLRVETDTPRIDPEMYLTAEEGGLEIVEDKGGEGEAEYAEPIQVKPGTYYVRIRNVKSLYPLPAAGEYTLFYDYQQKFFDDHEPNNRSYQATTIAFDKTYNGVFDSSTDEDWFQFRIHRRSLATVNLTGIPADRYMYYTLYTSVTQQKFGRTSPFGTTQMRMVHDLEPGIYYIRLMTDVQFQDKQYGLKVSRLELVAGFADIGNHWARQSIERLVGKGILKGYGDYKFAPNRTLTRAEATTMLVRAFGLNQVAAASREFPDVEKTHWASGTIATAASNGIIFGYPDGTFRPNEPVSRAEMAVMTALAAKRSAKQPTTYFSDVPASHWASGYIYAFVNSSQLQGFEDGTFRPNADATRAQFATLLSKVLQ